MVVGRRPSAPAPFTPGEIPGTHFSGAESTPGHMVLWGEPRKKSPVTPPGIDPGISRPVAQYLNHYATPGPFLPITPLLNLGLNTVLSTSIL